jgi:hypothetical protein
MYQTLADLKQAVDSGEVSGTMTLDNDEAFLYTDGDDGVEVFRMHPYDLLRQALDLLGIPHEEA